LRAIQGVLAMSILAIIVGMVMFIGAALDSERFMRTGRVYLIIEAFGRPFTRGVYLFSGMGCVLFGLYLMA
jgi:hypothetical protein